MFCKTGSRIQFQTLVARGVLASEGYVTPTLTVSRDAIDLVSRNAFNECNGASCSWWLITVHPWGGQQTLAVAPGAMPIPTENDMINRRRPGTTVLKARLTLADGAGKQRQVIVDIGAGFSVGWYGPSAGVEILYVPRNTANYAANTLIGRSQVIDLNASNQPLVAPAIGSSVEDVLIEANVVPLTSSPNIRAQTLTNTYRQFLTAPEGFVRVVPRPAGAQRVSVYQDQAGGSGPSWGLWAEPPFTGLTASQAGSPLVQAPGAVFPAASNVVPHQAVPGHAAGLIPGAGLLGTTVVWEIDP